MTEIEGIVPALARAMDKRGYSELTPVQKAVLAPEMAKADALVSAQTGSGKTVAFGIALAEGLLAGQNHFSKADSPLALVVAPTRELALQVKRELEWLYGETGAAIVSCVGGMDTRTERRNLERGAHIVVGTPGRLCDHIRRRSLDTSELKAVVLDEADEMLDLGFREDLEFILETTPQDRRTLMFSATVPRTIANMAKKYQRDALRITTSEEKKQHLDIEYRAMVVAPREQENAIINVLRFYESKNALVFCNTRATVNHMVARFNNRGFSVVALSGELSQNERTHALQAMRDGRARVCIATDVAARGIDLPNLDLVVHADLPSNPETLLHRSGRTGRAGRKGVSALIVPHNRRRSAERLLGFAKIRANWANPPSADDVIRRDDERLLADPVLIDDVSEDERDIVDELLTVHGPDKIAAAFIRLNRSGKSAPEELSEVPVHQSRGESQRREPRDNKRGPDPDFGPSFWCSISVGRKQNAEPRWLIPMLCKAGGLTKRDIGHIKMQANETFIEIAEPAQDKFRSAIGPNKTLEKSVTVKFLDGKPSFSEEKYSGKPPHKKSESGHSKPPERNFRSEKRWEAAADGPRRKPKSDGSVARPAGKKSKSKKSRSSKDVGKPARFKQR